VSFSSTAIAVLKTVAPTIATALGGPLAGTAAAILVKSLGGDPKAADKAIASGDPDTLVKLQQIDSDFKAKMAELGVEEEQLSYADVASARTREEIVRDWTPSVLAYAVTVGFFGILSWMLVKGIPRPGGDVLLVMLGALGAGWTSIMSYYFGSSAGAKKSNETLAAIAKQP
jgi:hypothetical protein